MRWIVISLLLVNALILGWRWWANENETPVPTRSAPAVQPAIELLPDGAVAPALSDASASANEDVVVEAPVDANASNQLPDTLTPDLVGDGSANPNGLSEPAGATTEPPAAPVAQAIAHCAWTDWHTKPPAVESGSESIQAEQREQEIGRSYLVYIPALASRGQTLTRLAEVKALGVEAAFLNKGPQAGGISLGLFSKPESMQIRMAELGKAGVSDALGIERIRTETQTRQLIRWTGEKTPTSVQNQALVSCNDVAPASSGQ